MSDSRRILLVDDEPHIVKVAGKRLEFAGYHVSVAMDGEEALTKIQQEPFDLIVLDAMLPKRNGYDLCRTLKQDTRYQHIPILLFTAKAQENDRKFGMECGADGYVTKPFQAAVLLEQIHTLLKEATDTHET